MYNISEINKVFVLGYKTLKNNKNYKPQICFYNTKFKKTKKI